MTVLDKALTSVRRVKQQGFLGHRVYVARPGQILHDRRPVSGYLLEFIYNESGFFALSVFGTQPIRYHEDCASLRTQS